MNLVNGALVPFLVLMAVYMFCGIFSGAMIPAFMNDLAVFNRANYHSGGPAFNAASEARQFGCLRWWEGS